MESWNEILVPEHNFPFRSTTGIPGNEVWILPLVIFCLSATLRAGAPNLVDHTPWCCDCLCPFLVSLGLREVLVDVLDVDEGPSAVVALADVLKPGGLGGVPSCRVEIADGGFDAW